MSMLRVYNLDAMHKVTNEIITVRLWAHNYDEACGKAIPFIANELDCQEANIAILGEHGKSVVIPATDFNATLRVLLDIIERSGHWWEGEPCLLAYQLLTRTSSTIMSAGPLPTKGKSEAQS